MKNENIIASNPTPAELQPAQSTIFMGQY